MVAVRGTLLILFFLSSSFGWKLSDNQDSIEINVEFVSDNDQYILRVGDSSQLVFYYIIAEEQTPELMDRDLFIDIVEAPSHGWPVIDAGYIDPRYGQHEFSFDLANKYFYLLGADGQAYSTVMEYQF